MAPLNGIDHGDAHSAIGDVMATVGIAKIIFKKAPNVWKASLMTTNKDKSFRLIQNEEMFCTDFFYYGTFAHEPYFSLRNTPVPPGITPIWQDRHLSLQG